MIGKLIFLLCVAACIYIAILGMAYFGQSRMIFFPSGAINETPLRIGLGYDDVWLKTNDGTRIHGWYVPKAGARWTMLMLHGNGGNISHRLQTLQILNEIGASTLIIDYHGYGMSEGRPSEQGTYEDAMAAWTYLTETKTSAANIVVFGRSLGGAVAVWLAAEVNPAGLILESTFTSLTDLAHHHYPLLPVGFISKYKYDSLALVRNITSPVLLLHSRADTIVPFELGIELFDALPGEKSFLEMQGGHNDGFYTSGQKYTIALKAFLESL
ncbi:alpha/beta hydrolase [Gammaproteobacteria bacterium]|nr:alpha/beta hydrolase [Gammaproteobacteria bacterium]